MPIHICVVHLLSKGVPTRKDTFLSWHLAPVSDRSCILSYLISFLEQICQFWGTLALQYGIFAKYINKL
jgi:hypothetical protein